MPRARAPKTVSDLAPNPRNPRKISARARKALDKSQAEFGDLSGFVHNRRTGHLIGGHQRRSLRPDAPIVITEKFRKPDALGTVARGYAHIGDDRIPYRQVDWPVEKERAALLAANQHGGEFASDALSALLSDLERDQVDMDLTGFFGDALAEARKEAYDSLAKLERAVEAEKKVGAPEKAEAPGLTKPVASTMGATLLALTLTPAEAALWSECKKQLAQRDDKAAFLDLLKSRLTPNP